MMIEPLSDVARHFQMLHLITTDRYVMSVKHENVRSHQYGVAKQAHGNTKIGIFTLFNIVLHSCLVGMCPVHQTLCC